MHLNYFNKMNKMLKNLFISWCLDWWHDMFTFFLSFFPAFLTYHLKDVFYDPWIGLNDVQWTQLCLGWRKDCLIYKLGSRFSKTCRTHFVWQPTSRRWSQSVTGKYHSEFTMKLNLESNITSSKHLMLLQTLPQPFLQILCLSLNWD